MAHKGRWRYDGQHIPLSEEGVVDQTCAAVDPIMALKKTTTLEGLQNGAVASDHAVCSEMGNLILQQGGNAVDAAVTVMLCLGVANPASSGLGGGAFILIHSESGGLYQAENPIARPPFHDERDQVISLAEGKITEIIDAREIAPAAASEDMFLKAPLEDASIIGGLSIGVPGELRGLELAHARHGKLPWASLVEPVIRLAQDGVAVTNMLSFEIAFAAAQLKHHGHSDEEFSSLRQLITKDDNWSNGLKEGDVLKNPQLAKTLRSVMEKGSDGLYKGENAKNLIADIRAAGGILTQDDLHDYLPTLRSPLVAEVNGFTMVSVPPPSSGGATVIGAARFLSGYSSPFASAADTLSIHRMVEAMRHAFAIRMSLSDPAFHSNVTKNAVRDLVSGPYMESLRKLSKDNDTLTLSQYGGKRWGLLDDDDAHTHGGDHHEGDRHTRRRRKGLRRTLRDADDNKRRNLYRPFGYLEDSGTSHLSVVDKDGNAVSVTSSINTFFGSYVCSESTGVLLGNTMDGKYS
jgi:gamma-glutamyltranspeptidase